jgi:hypothetical protein
MGRFSDASFTAEPITSDADQDGRESTQLFNITVQLSLMQGSNAEIEMIPDLSLPEDETNYPNGHTIYFSGDNQLSTSDLNSALTNDLPDFTTLGDPSDDPYDPQGMCFVNVLLKPSLEANLAGEVTMISLEFTGRVSTRVFEGFNDNTQSDGNHIVISPT